MACQDLYVVRVQGPPGDGEGYVVLGHTGRPTWQWSPTPPISREEAEALLELANNTCGGSLRLELVTDTHPCAGLGKHELLPEFQEKWWLAIGLLDTWTMEEMVMLLDSQGAVPEYFKPRLDLYKLSKEDNYEEPNMSQHFSTGSRLPGWRSDQTLGENTSTRRIEHGPRGGRFTRGKNGYRRYF